MSRRQKKPLRKSRRNPPPAKKGSKVKRAFKKAKKLNKAFVSTSMRLLTRTMLAGVGLFMLTPAEDSLLGPFGVITAPFTALFGIGLIGSSVLLPADSVSKLFLRATGVARVLEGGEAPALPRRRSSYGGYGGYGRDSSRRDSEHDDYDLPDEGDWFAKRTAMAAPRRRSAAPVALGLGAAGLLGLGATAALIWFLTKPRRDMRQQLAADQYQQMKRTGEMGALVLGGPVRPSYGVQPAFVQRRAAPAARWAA